MINPITLGTVADTYGIQLWRLQKLVNKGKIPVRGKIGNVRVVNQDDLPAIEQVLRDTGLLAPSPAA